MSEGNNIFQWKPANEACSRAKSFLLLESLDFHSFPNFSPPRGETQALPESGSTTSIWKKVKFDYENFCSL